MKVQLPDDWRAALEPELDAASFQELQDFVKRERAHHTIFPPEDQVFRAFELSPYEATRVLVLGQDPYHGAGQAHGLSFSVPDGVKPPPSLVNIFKELNADLGHAAPANGDLSDWAEQGVLLLNAVMTVREGQPASHKSRGWERFTDGVIRALVRRRTPSVFLFWGNYAKKKTKWVTPPSICIEGVHPSPLSASRGFFGSRPFSAVNAALGQLGQPPIEWGTRRSRS